MKRFVLLPLVCLICQTAWAQDSADDYLKQYGVYDIVEQYGNDTYDDMPQTYPSNNNRQNTQPTGDDYLKQYGVYDTVQQYAPSNNNRQNTKTTNPSNNNRQNTQPTGDDYLKQYGVYDTVQQYAPSNNNRQNTNTTNPQNNNRQNTKTTNPSNNNRQITQPVTGNSYNKPYQPSTGRVQTNNPPNRVPSSTTGNSRQPSQTGSGNSPRNSVYTGYDDIDAILKDNGIDEILSDPTYNTYDYGPSTNIQVYQPEPIGTTGVKSPSLSGSTTPPTQPANTPVITQPAVTPTPAVKSPQQVVTAPVAKPVETVPAVKPTVTTPAVTAPKPTNTKTVSNTGTTGIPSALASLSESYYAHLNSTQKRYYDAIYEAARKHQAVIHFDGEIDTNAMKIAADSVVLDHPEIVWMVAAYSEQMEYDESGSRIAHTTVEFEFLPLNFTDYQAFVNEAEKILVEARKLTTPLEKEKFIYDWVVTHTSYGSSTYDQTAYSALIQHQAVCAGFSALFHYLMNRLGIPTYVVPGYANFEENSGEHAWNIILLNGRYYNVDPTARPMRERDKNGNIVLKPYYDLYNKSDRVFRNEGYIRDSERGEHITLPACPD